MEEGDPEGAGELVQLRAELIVVYQIGNPAGMQFGRECP